jgi:hypothetical protein
MLHDRGVFHGLVNLRYLLELVQLSKDEDPSLDWSWIEEKYNIRWFKIGVELQARMARRLFNEDALSGRQYTPLGAFMHQRRLLKAHSNRPVVTAGLFP